MKQILVCVKAVPQSTSAEMDGAYRLKRDTTNLQWNISDESALEAALQLRGEGTRVTVLTMGPPKLEGALKELLARGADRAVLVTDPALAGADTRATSLALKYAIEKIGPFDLILCGRRAMDGETGQVPPQLAAALSLPCVTNVESIEKSEKGLLLQRRLDQQTQTLLVKGRGVVSICEYTYRLRPVGILSMRKAKNKTVEIYSAADLGMKESQCGLKGSSTRVVRVENTFPGLRCGKKETDTKKGITTLLDMLREVKA